MSPQHLERDARLSPPPPGVSWAAQSEGRLPVPCFGVGKEPFLPPGREFPGQPGERKTDGAGWEESSAPAWLR